MSKLNILGATYGPKVVTDTVKALVVNDTLTVTANTATFGDHWVGKGKTLTVVYQYDQAKPAVLIIKGNTTDKITPPSVSSPHREPFADGKLTILGAAYGLGEVTTKLQNYIVENRIHSKADNSNFKDTWVGKDKTFTVVYQYRGTPQTYVVKARETIKIIDMALPSEEHAPISKMILEKIGGAYDPLAQATYDFTTGNKLKIFQTPNVWHQHSSPAKITPASEKFVIDIQNTIAAAVHFVDITTMWPLPNGRFLSAIKNGIDEIHKRGHHVTIRILVGKPVRFPGYSNAPRHPETEAVAWFKELTAGLSASSMINIYLAEIQPRVLSWNHSKIIAVDAKKAFVGGHNLWHKDYLDKAPVHDVTVLAEGRAALSAHYYADEIWVGVGKLITESLSPKDRAWAWNWIKGKITESPAHPKTSWHAIAAPNRDGGACILALGNLGRGLGDAKRAGHNASSTAQAIAISKAEHSIKISQQNLYIGVGEVVKPNGPFFAALAERILTGHVQVDVVVTDDKESYYSTGISIERTYQEIKSAVLHRNPKFNETEINKRLRIAPLRALDSMNDGWIYRDEQNHIYDRKPYANHAKIYIIDDKAFYVGSHNLYACDLQEFGYFIEDEEQTRVLLNEYWNELWLHSSENVYKDKFIGKVYRSDR